MSLITEIAEYLEDNSVGTRGTDIFAGYLPDNVDTAVAVLDTGGVQPSMDINSKHPTIQIFVRGTDYATGKAKLDSVRALLHQKRNTTLISGGTFIYYIFAQSEGGHIGRNERGLDEFSANYICRHR